MKAPSFKRLLRNSVSLNGGGTMRVPEARNNLAQHVAAGGVLGKVGNLVRVL